MNDYEYSAWKNIETKVAKEKHFTEVTVLILHSIYYIGMLTILH